MNNFDAAKPNVAFIERLRLRVSAKLMRILLKYLPNDPAILTRLGIAEFLLGKYEEAARTLRSSLDLEPSQPAALLNFGMTLEALGKDIDALKCYDHVLLSWPDYPHVRSRRDALREHIGKSNSLRDVTEGAQFNLSRGGWHTFGNASNLQQPSDVAVIMPTIGRPSILQAVRSVFAQSDKLRIQLLIGIDSPSGNFDDLLELLKSTPAHITGCLFHPGYSTSIRHGGLHPARDGGTLRTTLTYLANAKYVTYLDDDNWWDDNHLSLLSAAISEKDWAYSRRWFVHPETSQPVCEDIWESVGPGSGIYADKFGGWVDPNCLMFNKLSCEPAIRLWSTPLPGSEKAMDADRQVYEFLQRKSAPGTTDLATVFYTMQPEDGMHARRLALIGEGYHAPVISQPRGARSHPKVSLITTCKGRRHHLELTLPNMVMLQEAEVIVVDYGCPMDTANWVRENYPSVKVAEVTDDLGFCVARARNIGARSATAPWLLFIDADILINPDFMAWVKENARRDSFYIPIPIDLESFGTVLCTKDAYYRVGGYDEAFKGWGGEDWDFYYQLRREKFAQSGYPQKLVSPIRHGNDERTKFYGNKNKAYHHLVTQIYLHLKWDAEAIYGKRLSPEERSVLMKSAQDAATQFGESAGVVKVELPLGESLFAPRYMEWKTDRRLVVDIAVRAEKIRANSAAE